LIEEMQKVVSAARRSAPFVIFLLATNAFSQTPAATPTKKPEDPRTVTLEYTHYGASAFSKPQPVSKEVPYRTNCEGRFELATLAGVEHQAQMHPPAAAYGEIFITVKKLIDGSAEAPKLHFVPFAKGSEVDLGDDVDFAGWKEKGYRIKSKAYVNELSGVEAVEMTCD